MLCVAVFVRLVPRDGVSAGRLIFIFVFQSVRRKNVSTSGDVSEQLFLYICDMLETKTIRELYEMLRRTREYLHFSDNEIMELVMSRRPVELLIIVSGCTFIGLDNAS